MFERLEVACAPKNGKKAAVIGGVLQYGIPEFRLPKTVLERYKKKRLSIGIKSARIPRLAGLWRLRTCFGTAIISIQRDAFVSPAPRSTAAHQL
jgi:glutamate synthase (NADPH/NADH) small chain